MHINQVTLEEAQANLDGLCDLVTSGPEVVLVSRPAGKDVALIAAKELSALKETLHLLGSEKNARRLLAALQRK